MRPAISESKYKAYNGADDQLVYRTGFAVFDRSDPRHLLMRSSEPIFAPEKDWEKAGQVPNVVFVEGAVPQRDHYFFYYGGADKYVGVAQADVSLSTASITPHK
jgi:beta-1,2-mannosidase